MTAKEIEGFPPLVAKKCFKAGAVVFDQRRGAWRKADRAGGLTRPHKWTVYDDGRPLGFLFDSAMEAIAHAVKLTDQAAGI
jgi:hypothetical protein